MPRPDAPPQRSALAVSALAVYTLAAVPAVCAAAAAEPPVDTPGSEALGRAIRSHISFLADDALAGRESGTPEHAIAALYVATRFQALGLTPAGDDGSYLQQVPLRRNELVAEEARVVLHRDGESLELTWAEDFLMRGDPSRTSTEVTAPVVFVGRGISAPELGWDDYAGVDVEGKIVLQLSGAPPSFPHNQRAYYSSGRTKRETAVDHGAVGFLLVRTAEDAARGPWERIARNAPRPGMGWFGADGAVQGQDPRIQGAALLSHPGAEKLLVGSAQSLEEVLAAASEGATTSFELPVEATLATRSIHADIESANVAAVLPGTDPELAGEYVVYTAHLDHVGVGAPHDGDDIYNGAYDNATGVAVMLEVARLFVEGATPPRRSVLFLAVTAEEHGLVGSDYFAHHPTVPASGMVADVNLDMPLFLYPLADVIAFGAEHSSLSGPVERAAEAVGFTVSPDPMPQEVIFIRSDQYSFVRKGVPAVFMVAGHGSLDPEIDGAKEWVGFRRTHYHMPSDDLSQPFHGESAARFARLNYLIGLEVAQAEERPTWNEGDFFGEKFGKR